MKIAIPVEDGRLFSHFGQTPAFALIDADDKSHAIVARSEVSAPPHEPGLLPNWLAERGVTVVLAGGIGERAERLFAQKGIKVVSGVAEDSIEAIVAAYFAGTLSTGNHCCHHHH